MIKMRWKSLTIALAFGALTPLAAAQTATPPQTASTQAAPPKSEPPTPPLPPQTISALKLAGLVTFVANSCPTLKPNYDRFAAAIKALGVTEADLNKMDMRGRYLGYTARYNADVKTSCQRAETQFGPRGTTLPDIFLPQSASNSAPH